MKINVTGEHLFTAHYDLEQKVAVNGFCTTKTRSFELNALTGIISEDFQVSEGLKHLQIPP